MTVIFGLARSSLREPDSDGQPALSLRVSVDNPD
jgi:hypothetical protein